MEPIKYRQEFLKSIHHLYFGVGAWGIPLIFSPSFLLALIVGAIAYSLVWVFVPDMKFFMKTVDEKYAQIKQQNDLAKMQVFNAKRERMLIELDQNSKAKYWDLVSVCQEIEKSAMDTSSADPVSADPRLRKLDELMWTYLRLLRMKNKGEAFLVKEQDSDLSKQVDVASKECQVLQKALDEMKTASPNNLAIPTRQRFFDSRNDRLDALKKRLERVDSIRENLQLIEAEQERLCEQVKLIRSDTVATKNADAFSTRIDASVEHLDKTQQLFSQLDELSDVMSDEVPVTETARIGYGDNSVPIYSASTNPVIKPVKRARVAN
jgi:hypothetical protein